jgi:pimeloyl-ACP methyl ester carboxylesterase
MRKLASGVMTAVLLSLAPMAAAQTTETGVIDGATYRIDMPKAWNKGVVVMNHGYSPEPRIPAAGEPSARLRVFLDRGFAVAQSSYSKGGWAVEQALTDNVKLLKHFEAKHGDAQTVIATGGAMGASITTASVEMQPDIYDAGLVTCCSGLDPRLENMNWNFEMLALFDYYFPGLMPPVVGPLGGYEYSIGANSPMSKKIQAALDANPEKAEIFRRAWGRKKEDVASTVAFHTYLIHEAQERSGGNPFSNETTIYQVDDDLVAVNSGVKRFAADPGKNAYLKQWYTASGNLKKPLMILSPVYDPIVPSDTTEAYMAIARRAGTDHLVSFQFFDHFGHGSVTTAEVAAAFDELLAWMKGGPKPKNGHGVNRADPPRAGAGQ